MTTTGRAVVLLAKDRLALHEFQVPEVAPESALVAITLSGICGTDRHYIRNADLPLLAGNLPRIPGHEFCGRVVALGSKANEVMYSPEPLAVGDRVVVYGLRFCQRCWWDVHLGVIHGQLCTNRNEGWHSDPLSPPHFLGGWADYFYVQPGSWFWKIPDEITDEVAVLTEPFSIGIRGVEKAMSLPGWKNEQMLAFGGVVAVLGTGAIGVLTALAARIAGAGTIIMLGPSSYSLTLAREMGIADHTINTRESSVEARIAKVRSLGRGGLGADVVFGAAGRPEAFVQGLEMLRKAGTIVEMGNFLETNQSVPVDVARLITRKELILYGVANQPPQYWEKALRTMASTQGSYDYSRLVTRIFPLADYEQALRAGHDYDTRGIKLALAGAAYES